MPKSTSSRLLKRVAVLGKLFDVQLCWRVRSPFKLLAGHLILLSDRIPQSEQRAVLELAVREAADEVAQEIAAAGPRDKRGLANPAYALLRHYVPGAGLVCECCGFSTYIPWHFEKHRRGHGAAMPAVPVDAQAAGGDAPAGRGSRCPKCRLPFTDPEELKRHVASDHRRRPRAELLRAHAARQVMQRPPMLLAC